MYPKYQNHNLKEKLNYDFGHMVIRINLKNSTQNYFEKPFGMPIKNIETRNSF